MRGRPSVAGHTLPNGTMLAGRYQIERVIGTGGMSVVYAARDRRFRAINRTCAVKEMFDGLTDNAMRQRAVESFEREANLLASLNHGSVPKVYDYFTEGERHYLVYEFIEGQDLGRLLQQRSRPVQPERVVEWGLQLASVLNTLHAATPPIVFRDLKPSNVMLRPDGQIVLIDFGIAKHFQSLQKGTMIGTEGYAPPEQYEGTANPQVDIYALGATLHHLLTNTDPQEYRPFSFDQRPVRQYNTAVPVELETAIMRAVKYNAHERWPSMVALSAALLQSQRALTTKPGTGTTNTFTPPPPPKAGSATAPIENDDATRAGSGLLARLRQKVTRPVSAPAPPPLTPATDETVSFEQRQQSRSKGKTALKPTPPPTRMPLQNEGTVDFEAPLDDDSAHVPLWTFATEDEVRSSPELTEDSVYIGSYDNNIYCIDRITGDFRWKYATEGGIPGRPAVWQELVIVGSEDATVYGLNRRTGRAEWTATTRGRVRSSPAITLDYCYIGSDDGHLYALNCARGHLMWKSNLSTPIRSTAAIGEKQVFIGTEDGTLAAMDLVTGDVMWRVKASGAIIASPVVHGVRVVAGSMDRTLYGVDQQSGWVVWRVRLSDRIYASPVIQDDLLFVCTVDGVVYCLDAEWGKEQWKCPLGAQITSSPVVDNGMLYVGGANGTLYAVNVKKGKPAWKFRTGGPIPGSPRVRDGVVYFGSMDDRVYAVPTLAAPRAYR